jgi:hypothetical protein
MWNEKYEIKKMILDGVLTKTPFVHEETFEEKEKSEYLKTIGVKSFMVICKKTFPPILSIKFEDGIEEYHKLSVNQFADDWKSLLDISEKVKNNKQIK